MSENKFLRDFKYRFFFLVFLFAAIPLLNDSLSKITSNNLPDTRWISLEWIIKNIPPKSIIAREDFTPPIEEFTDDFKIIRLGLSGLIRKPPAINKSVDYVVLSSYDYSKFFQSELYADEAVIYSEFFSNHELIYEIKPKYKSSSGPTVRVYRTRF